MSLAWIIYFIDVICSGWQGLGVLLVLTIALWLILQLIAFLRRVCPCSVEDEARWQAVANRKQINRLAAVSFCLLLLSGFIPSKQTAYAMLAAYGVETLAENERVQELGGKSLEVLEKAMDTYLKEDNDDRNK